MDAKKFLELYERSNTGKQVTKNEWDMEYIVEHVMDMVDKYDLSWDKNVIVPNDNELLDKLFQASRELLLENGIYNMTTGRIMTLSPEEVDDGIANMKQELVMGEGKDAYTLRPRKIEDTAEPCVWAGNPGAPTPERLYLPILQSVAKEPVVDLLTCGSLIDVDGYPVKSGGPTEVFAVRREMKYLHQALEEAGRPGMGLLAAESAVTAVGDYAASADRYLRPCDSHLVALFNELIMDDGNLVRAANAIDYGVRNASLACTMVGGLGGDAPGSCLIMMASMMAANLFAVADYHLCHPIHINDVATSARSCLWLQSVLCQSFAKNAPCIIVCDIWPASGAMTKELLYEVAANSIVVTVSGGHLEGLGSANGRVPNGTGLECRLMGEVGKAVARQGMTREEANDIVLKLLPKYEYIFGKKDGNPGVSFDRAYNMETIEPLPEWQAMYDDVKEELRQMGIRF